MKKISKSLLILSLAVVTVFCFIFCTVVSVRKTFAETNYDWNTGWQYQTGKKSGTEVAVDQSGYVVTDDDITAKPSIFQTEKSKPTRLNGYKMTFVLEPGDEGIYDANGNYKVPNGNADEQGEVGAILLLAKPGWYTNSPNAGFGLFLWPEINSNQMMRISIRIVDKEGVSRHGNGGADNVAFYTDGRANTFETKAEPDGTFYMYVNGAKLTTTGAIDNEIIENFTAGLCYTNIFMSTSAFGKGKITVRSIECTEPELPLTLAKGSDKVVFETSNLSEGYSQYDENSPAVTYYESGLRKPVFSTTSNDASFYVKGRDLYNIKGSLVGFTLDNGGKFVSGEKFGIYYVDNDGKQLRLYFEPFVSQGTVISGKFLMSAYYYNGSSEEKITENPKEVALHLNNSMNTLQLGFSINKTIISFNNQAVDLGDITSAISKMNFVNDNFNYAFNKMGAEGGNTAILQLVKFVSCVADTNLPVEVNGELTTNTLYENDGVNAIKYYNSGETGFELYFKNPVLADSLGLKFKVDRTTFASTNNDYFKFVLENITGSHAITFSFKKDGEVTKVIIDVDDDVIYQDTTNRFYWDGSENYLGFAKSYDYNGYILTFNRANASNPTVLDENANTAIDSVIKYYNNSQAMLKVLGGNDKLTVFQLIKTEYYVPRGVQSAGYSVGSGSAPEWGYYSDKGQATLGSLAQTSWTVTMPSEKVPVKNFKMVFDMYRNDTVSLSKGVLIFISSSNIWYTEASAAIGMEFLYLSDKSATAMFKYNRNETYGGSKVVGFNWHGRNTLEFRYNEGTYSIVLNNTALDYGGDLSGFITENLISKFQGLNALGTLQIWNNNTDSTIIIRELNLQAENKAPKNANYISDDYDSKTFSAGKEIKIDLTKYFVDADKEELRFEITDGKGRIEGNYYIFKPTTEDIGDNDIQITCYDNALTFVRQSFTIKVVKASKGGCSSLTLDVTAVMTVISALAVVFITKKRTK